MILHESLKKWENNELVQLLGSKMNRDSDLESNVSQSVFGEEKKPLRMKFRLAVSPHLGSKYKPKRIEADDMAEFFLKVMKIKQEHMSTVKWSNKKVTLQAFICDMHLTDPDVYDKANYKYVTNGNYVLFGEKMQEKPRWMATFETSNDKSGVAFIVQKPLSKGLTKANKFELCAQLRKRHDICSDMYDVKHQTTNATIAETSSDDWLFFALFVSPEFEYPLFTSGPIPFNLDGKNVFLNIRRKENLQQLEERLKQTKKTEAEIKAIIAKKKAENYINNAKIQQRLEKASAEEARSANALAEIDKINVVEPLLSKKEYLTIKIQQAQTKFEKERYAAKRAIILREEEKQKDLDYFQMMRETYDVENPNTSKWRQLMTNSMRQDLCLFMRTYDERSRIEDQRVNDHYDEMFGHLDRDLESEFERYKERVSRDLPLSPFNPGQQNESNHEQLSSTQNEKNLHEEIQEASNVGGTKRKLVITPENQRTISSSVVIPSKRHSKVLSQGSDGNDNLIDLNSTKDKFMERLHRIEGLPQELPGGANVARMSELEGSTQENDEELERLEAELLATPVPRRTIGRSQGLYPNMDEFRMQMAAAEADENGTMSRNDKVDFIRNEEVHTGDPLEESFYDRNDPSPTKLAGNSKGWGYWNKRKWNYFIHSLERDGINCLRHNMDWRRDNMVPFLGRIFTRSNAKDHVQNFYKLFSCRPSDLPMDDDEWMDMKAALYFLGPRNSGLKAHFSRENLESLSWEETLRMPGKLVDIMAIKRTPAKIDSLIPLWIQAMTLLNEEERHTAWSYGSTKLGIYARPLLDSQGCWRLLNGSKWLHFLRHPDDIIGTNIVGERIDEKGIGPAECFS